MVRCEKCGGEFKRSGLKRFCSQECREAYFLNPHEIVCKRCGKTGIVSSYTQLCQDCRDEDAKKHHKTDLVVGGKYDMHEYHQRCIRERYERQYKGKSKGIDEYAKKDAERRRNGQAHISYGMAMAKKAGALK